MNKSGIEYLTHVWNFYTGCRNQENGVCNIPCWARSMAKRFHRSFEPVYHPDIAFPSFFPSKGGKRIGVCFTGDLFGNWIDPTKDLAPEYYPCADEPIILRDYVFDAIKTCPNDRFFFLTKCPWNIKRWGIFPDNAYVGVSVTSNGGMTQALTNLAAVEAKHKWISFEPLLGSIGMSDHMSLKAAGISWVVIGAQTQPYKPPRIEGVKEIVEAADKAGVPVFEKNNLIGLLNRPLRQELPR